MEVRTPLRAKGAVSRVIKMKMKTTPTSRLRARGVVVGSHCLCCPLAIPSSLWLSNSSSSTYKN
jgi:hypothetical protein